MGVWEERNISTVSSLVLMHYKYKADLQLVRILKREKAVLERTNAK